MKVTNKKDNDEEYKEENYQDINSNESVINKTEEEESLIELFMSINLPFKVLNDVIGTISPRGKI